MYCPICGALVSDGENICLKCGYKKQEIKESTVIDGECQEKDLHINEENIKKDTTNNFENRIEDNVTIGNGKKVFFLSIPFLLLGLGCVISFILGLSYVSSSHKDYRSFAKVLLVLSGLMFSIYTFIIFDIIGIF